MKARVLLLAAVLLGAGMAGCIGDGDDGEDADTASNDPLDSETNDTEENETEVEETGPTITSTWKNATWEGASTPGGLGYYCNPPITVLGECDNSLAFSVAGNASAVVAEVAWDSSEEFFVTLDDGEGNRVAQTTDSSPIQLVVEDELPEDSAEWELTAWVDSTTPTEVEATFVGSVVEDGELPADFAKVE